MHLVMTSADPDFAIIILGDTRDMEHALYSEANGNAWYDYRGEGGMEWGGEKRYLDLDLGDDDER